MDECAPNERPCPACSECVILTDVLEGEECPKCETPLADLFEEAGQDPKQLGGVVD